MSTAVRTVYIELRASAERLQQDLVDVTGKLDRVGQSGKDAGARVSAGMTTASESFGKVAKSAAEAVVAVEGIAKAVGRYSTVAAASGTTTEGLVNTYRALRIALDPTMFTASTVALGFLTEETIRLTNARARLIAQQSLIAAKSGASFGSVDKLDAVAGISGGNAATIQSLQSALSSRIGSNASAVTSGLETLGVSGSMTDPDLLQKIAQGFASIEDPAKRAAAAVQIFGADKAGAALQELNSGFVRASSAAQRYGLVLNEVSRNQIYTFRKDLIDLKDSLLDFSSEKAGWEAVKTRAEEIAAAFEDMAKRGTSALGRLIDKQTGLGGLGKPGELSASDVANANARKDSTGMGIVADDLFAQAQLSHFRQSQTLEGQQAAQRDAQGRADSAYSKLNDGTQRTPQERFSLATEQQSAQALATAIGVRVKAMQDAAEAEEKAKTAAEQLAAFQAGAGERLNALYRSSTLQGMHDPVARSMYEGQIEIRRDADKTTDDEKAGRAAIATQNFRQALAQLQQQLAAGVLANLAKEESEKLKVAGEAMRKQYDTDSDADTKQKRVSEIQAQGWSQPAEAQNSMAKLQAERVYSMEIGHTFQQRLDSMRQIAQLDNQAAAIKVTQARDELNIATAEGDTVRAADAQLKLEKAISDQKNQQYQAATQILVTQQQQTLTLQQQVQSATAALQSTLQRNNANIGNSIGDAIGNLPKSVGDDIGGAISNALLGHHPGESIGQAMSKALVQSLKQTAAGLLKTLISGGVQFGLGLLGFADGTDSAPGGMAIVGERGPEIMNVPRGAQIIPNSVLRSGAASISANQPTRSNTTSSSSSTNYGGHTFNVTQHIYESQDAMETARQIRNGLKSLIPSAADYSS